MVFCCPAVNGDTWAGFTHATISRDKSHAAFLYLTSHCLNEYVPHAPFEEKIKNPFIFGRQKLLETEGDFSAVDSCLCLLLGSYSWFWLLFSLLISETKHFHTAHLSLIYFLFCLRALGTQGATNTLWQSLCLEMKAWIKAGRLRKHCIIKPAMELFPSSRILKATQPTCYYKWAVGQQKWLLVLSL